MSQPLCPKCSLQLNDDYGMATCAGCGSIVFVDMDGMAHFSEESAKSEVKVASKVEPGEGERDGEASGGQSFSLQPQSQLPDWLNQETNPEPDISLDVAPAIDSVPTSGFEDSGFHDSGLQSLDSKDSGDSESKPVIDEPFNMDFLLGHSPADQASEARDSIEDFAKPGDPLGTNEFANSELSQAKDGPFLYKILISGIDSKEIRESLRSALDDQRFAWNPNDLMLRISKGVMAIDNVAPVKAVILINRIKRLPLKVSWGQYAITQMDTH